ncbi:MAG: hypothetical protein ABSB88_25050 [Bryobacteraceae bacterium]
MKSAALLVVLTLAPAGAQIQIPSAPPSSVAAKPATGTVGSERAPVALEALTALEKDIDRRIATTGGVADACVVIGGTRGLYVTGFGTVFTSLVDLINSPSIGLFQPTISPEQKADVHKRKLAHLTLLQNSMRETLMALAQSASLKSMAGTDQIVVGVRLWYRPWEDTTGLPGEIVMRADRQGGNIRMELQ